MDANEKERHEVEAYRKSQARERAINLLYDMAAGGGALREDVEELIDAIITAAGGGR